MKKLSVQFCFLLITSLFTFSSCLKDNDDGPWNNPNDVPGGIMFFVNNYPDAKGLIYRLDGNIISDGYGNPWVLGYQKFSFPQKLHARDRKIEVLTSENQEVIIDTTLTIKLDSGYTSFVYGTEEQPRFAMTQDKVIEDLKENEVGIRFLNLASGVGEVNLSIEGVEEPLYTDRPIETGASVAEHQAFRAHSSGTYTFKVTDAEGEELVRREYKKQDGSGLRGRYYYTIMLTGKADSDDTETSLYIGVVEH